MVVRDSERAAGSTTDLNSCPTKTRVCKAARDPTAVIRSENTEPSSSVIPCSSFAIDQLPKQIELHIRHTAKDKLANRRIGVNGTTELFDNFVIQGNHSARIIEGRQNRLHISTTHLPKRTVHYLLSHPSRL